jgi:type IV secretion system protein TrbI
VTPDPLVQKAATPPGNIPKGRQQYIMFGIAVVIIGGIIISDLRSPNPKAAAKLPPVNVAPASKTEIDRYTRQLAEQQERAKAAELEAANAKAMFQASTSGGPSVESPAIGQIPGQALVDPDGRFYYPAQTNANFGTAQPTRPNAEEEERRKRDYNSLFASNVALSLRPGSSANTSPVAAKEAPASVSSPESEPLLAAQEPIPSTVSIRTHLVFEGSIFEAVLTNRLEGGFNGPVNCQVTTPVYSHDHGVLLVPQGSRLLGESRKVAEQQQERLSIAFHRLIMPDGFSVSLDQMPGLDQEGATGLKDKTNNHYLAIFGTSIALGVLSGFSQYGTGSALTANGIDQYRQGVAASVAQNNSTVLQRQLNRLPSITIREGHRVKIYLTRDLSLPAYDEHVKRGDL